eukprot:scaffold12888_cov144-Isochrysis_galbana.AAC.4
MENDNFMCSCSGACRIGENPARGSPMGTPILTRILFPVLADSRMGRNRPCAGTEIIPVPTQLLCQHASGTASSGHGFRPVPARPAVLAQVPAVPARGRDGTA